MRVWKLMLIVLAASLCGASAFAGPNEGGTLVLHAETSIVYTTDTTSYCGQSDLASCAEAVTSVPADPGQVTAFFAMAAFPESAEPRLSGVTFGVDYDSTKFVLVAHGSCADFELATAGWPTQGAGTALTWNAPLTAAISELYWFAGYAYSEEATSFALTEHPTQGGAFGDDETPAALDPIVAFGTLGFGTDGVLACPSPGDGIDGGDFGEPDGVEEQLEPTDGGSGASDLGSLTFVELTPGTDSTFALAVRGLEADFGLRVLVAIVPDIVICVATSGQLDQLSNDARVAQATTSTIANAPTLETTTLDPGEPGLGPTIWNYVLSPAQPETTSYSFPYACGQMADSSRLTRGDVLPEYDQNRQTSAFMMGHVGISLFWLESQDSRPCASPDYTENWALSERTQVLAEFTQGLVEGGLKIIDPRAQVTFEIYDLILAPTSVEPIRGASTSDAWGKDAFAYAGYGSGDIKTRAYSLNNDRRRSWQMDWWYTALVVRDICDSDGLFSDGKSAFAWVYGPHLVITTKNGGYGINNLDYVFAHESCHIFGADDEYPSSDCGQHCSDRYGYLHVTTDNCSGCTSQQQACIMNSQVRPFRMCPSSRGQLGWRDSEVIQDGVFDPIEQPQASNSMRLEETTVSPGDIVDIKTETGYWVKRLALSEWDADRGGALWDGYNYAGVKVAPGVYIWQKNGTGSWHTESLFPEQDSPTLSDISVQSGNPPRLRFEFVDDDTYCGRVRATVKMPGRPDRYAIGDKFYIDTFGSVPPVDVPLDLSSGFGLYTIELRVWDSGGGREDVETIDYLYGGPAGVDERVGSLRLRGPGYPNPSTGSVQWRIAAGSERINNLGIFGVNGRLVRRVPSQNPEQGNWTILWDGRDETGRLVPSGRYFLRAKAGSGAQSVGEVTITR